MWRHLLQRMEAVVHPRLERQLVAGKSIHGIFCDSQCSGVDEGDVLCCIPFVHCAAPNLVAASPWGKQLLNALSSYSASGNGVRVEYSVESALTTAFCALLIHHSSSHLGNYLRWITIEEVDSATLRRQLGEEAYVRLQVITKLNESITHALCRDAAAAGLQVPIEAMERAHKICSSRCIDLPHSEQIFGGPAMVPLVDLVNHSEEEPNVVASVSARRLAMRALGGSRTFPQEHWGVLRDGHCPFYVVLRAARALEPGEELHYQYADQNDSCARDPLFWASRFHFCP
ncbi:hypothetical protein TRVL_04889 [Trypanosoma vivax]|uniref:Uncharacterized protein n=1 Tax=Trypanosoma vivax (strain Y486) TaxID=1055687 RepID=G0TXZ3_TRYVY|nr:hypothetical protein TRVL_04889 [Trypanosoma vivax]CCC48838.1 conserved hypothetical protein [Trypanosoma vivax Y486]